MQEIKILKLLLVTRTMAAAAAFISQPTIRAYLLHFSQILFGLVWFSPNQPSGPIWFDLTSISSSFSLNYLVQFVMVPDHIGHDQILTR